MYWEWLGIAGECVLGIMLGIGCRVLGIGCGVFRITCSDRVGGVSISSSKAIGIRSSKTTDISSRKATVAAREY